MKQPTLYLWKEKIAKELICGKEQAQLNPSLSIEEQPVQQVYPKRKPIMDDLGYKVTIGLGKDEHMSSTPPSGKKTKWS